MINRTIFPLLEKALNVKQIIVITGLRRIGKTTAVHHLLGKIRSSNKKFFDLERVEYRALFGEANYGNIVRSLRAEGLDFDKKAYIAIDEIQLVPNITSVIKYLYDTYNIKFILTGSSSFYIKNYFTESLAGRKRIFEMHPLTFGEYLLFKKVKTPVKKHIFRRVNTSEYNNLRHHYLDYINYGGFPEVVLARNIEDKKELLKDIINSYLRIDIKFLADFTRTDEIYKLITLLSSRASNKIDYTKLSNLSGIDRKTIKEYLGFFVDTYLIRLVPAFVRNADREIALQKKLYFTDNGILKILGQNITGILLENSVANQLALHGDIKYYAKKTGQEIDFILNDEISFEVKETPSVHDLKILEHRTSSLNLKKHYLTGLNISDAGFHDFVWAGSID
ncbi:MAG: ATP-binding protein [Bacteroidota bacterium]